MDKKPFDIRRAAKLIDQAIRPCKKAAMFELAEDGFGSTFEQLVACMISIGLFETLVEGDGDVLRRLPLEEVAEESRKAVHGVDRVAIRVGDLDRHRVIGAEDEYAGIDKIEHGRHSERVAGAGTGPRPEPEGQDTP